MTITQIDGISIIKPGRRKGRGCRMRVEINPEEPVYIISVVARIVGLHEQTIRLYERRGLICPKRTLKKTRLYSLNDIKRLKYIKYLTRVRGLNLAGVKMILDSLDDLDKALKEIEETQEMKK